MLNDFFVPLIGPWGIACWSFSIFFFALVGGLRLYQRTRPLLREFNSLRKKLEPLKGTEKFSSGFHDFDQLVRSSKLMKSAWNEFYDTLIFPDLYPVDEGRTNVIYCTQPAGMYFSRESLLTERVNLRAYNALPGLLTALGILGTFIGLVIGIYLAQEGLVGDDLNEVKNALGKLLSGASLAFSTSIAGLLASILFTVFERWRIHKFDRLLRQWNHDLDLSVERLTPESMACRSLEVSRQQNAVFESFTNDLAVSIGQALDEHVKTSPLLAQIEKMTQAIESMKQDRGDSLESVLKEMTEEFRKSLTSAAGVEMQALAETLARLGSDLRAQMQIMSEQHTQLQSSSKTILDGVGETFREGNSAMSLAVQDMRDAVSGLVEQLTGGLAGATKKMEEDLKGGAASLENELAKVGGQFSGRMEEFVQKTTLAMAQVAGKFTAAQGKLGETVEGLNVSVAEVRNTVEGMRGLSDGYQRSSERLAEAGKVFHQVVAEMSGLQDGLAQAGEKVSTSTQKMAGGIESLQHSLSATEQTWSSYEERFGEIDETLASVMRNISEGLSGYGETMRVYVRELDEHTAKITGAFSGAVNEFGEAIEDLEETLSKART